MVGMNFFDAVEQMVCEAVMSEGITASGVHARLKAIAVRDMIQLLFRQLDVETLGDAGGIGSKEFVARLDILGSALTAGMGVFVAIGCMNQNTPETRMRAYQAMAKDAEGFAKLIVSLLETFLNEAKKHHGVMQ